VALSAKTGTVIQSYAFVGALVVSFVTGVAASDKLQGSSLDIRGCNTDFSLLNPWIRCEDSIDLKKDGELEMLRQQLEEYIAEEQKSGAVSEVSVYFRDLENGPWFGINEDEDFAPASLLKVPIMISALKHAEEDLSLLERNVLTAPVSDGLAPVSSANGNEAAITMEQALEKMIIDSDNYSKDLILAYLSGLENDMSIGTALFIELNLSSDLPDGDDYIHVKNYASLFRILYNSSYLNKTMSQKALDTLAKSRFDEGLVGGIPKGVTVAHKYGIRTDLNQLHDCGIVYHPSDPYLICIMTRGNTIEDSGRVIREISKRVFEKVNGKVEL
jgi:beta-lactamase class A